MSTPNQAPSLVAELYSLAEQIALLKEREDDAKRKLIELGTGDYFDADGRKAQVIEPAAAIKPAADTIEQLRASLDGKIFEKLFTKVTSWKAIKEFRAVAGAILDKRAAAKLISSCESEAKPYVKLADK